MFGPSIGNLGLYMIKHGKEGKEGDWNLLWSRTGTQSNKYNLHNISIFNLYMQDIYLITHCTDGFMVNTLNGQHTMSGSLHFKLCEEVMMETLPLMTSRLYEVQIYIILVTLSPSITV